jgi:hypothetical protein
MDNTVGSLTQFQKFVIIGSILGDGHLRLVKGRKDAFLEINHSFKAKDYVDWKYKVLGNIVKSKPKSREGKEERIAYRFFTRQHPELTDLLEMFYKNGKKIISTRIKINPIILAVWYMDDGSKCGNSDVYLNTQQFDIEDQKRMLKALRKLGLKARLNKDKKYYRIRFLKSSLPRLKKLISEYIIPSMKYKIEL